MIVTQMLIWGITGIIVVTIEDNYEGLIRIVETINPTVDTGRLRHFRLVVVDSSRIRRHDFAENYFRQVDLTRPFEIDLRLVILPARILADITNSINNQ